MDINELTKSFEALSAEVSNIDISGGIATSPHSDHVDIVPYKLVDDQPAANGNEIQVYSEFGSQKGCPFDIICEFLQVVIRKKYPEAIELAKQILIYEPENQVVREFQELLSQERFLKEDKDSSDSESESSSDEKSESSSSSSSSSSSDDSDSEDSTYSTGNESLSPISHLQGDGDVEMLPDFDMPANIEKYILDEMNSVGMKAISKFFKIDEDASSSEDEDESSSTTTTNTSQGESSEEDEQDYDSGISNGGVSP